MRTNHAARVGSGGWSRCSCIGRDSGFPDAALGGRRGRRLVQPTNWGVNLPVAASTDHLSACRPPMQAGRPHRAGPAAIERHWPGTPVGLRTIQRLTRTSQWRRLTIGPNQPGHTKARTRPRAPSRRGCAFAYHPVGLKNIDHVVVEVITPRSGTRGSGRLAHRFGSLWYPPGRCIREGLTAPAERANQVHGGVGACCSGPCSRPARPPIVVH